MSLPAAPQPPRLLRLADLIGAQLYGSEAGSITSLDITISVNALAGALTVINQNVSPGRVWVFWQPWQLQASYYSDSITVSMTVDQAPLSGVATVYTLNNPANLQPGRLWAAKDSVGLTVNNQSSYDSVVSAVVTAASCDANYWGEVVRPLLATNVEALQEVVTAWRRSQGLKSGLE